MKSSDSKKHHQMASFITNNSPFFSVDANNRSTLEARIRLMGLEMVVSVDRLIDEPVDSRRKKIADLFAEAKK